MPIVVAEQHGISSEDESRDAVWNYTRKGQWDELTRFYHVENADPVAGAIAVKAVGAADSSYPQMFAVSHEPAGTSSDGWSEAKIKFLGRLINSDSKLTRRLITDTWTATRNDVTFGKVAGAKVHSDGDYPGTWSTESSGTEVAAALQMSHGKVVLEDIYISTTAPDASDVAWKTVSPGSTPYGLADSKIPVNPWWDIPDPTVYWPYGWVKDGHEVIDHVANSIFLYRDRFTFVHKYNP